METSEEGPRGAAGCTHRGSGRGLSTRVTAASGGCSEGFGTLTATRGVLPEERVCGVWHHLTPSDAHGASTCHGGPNATENLEDTDS